jgi:hypothetical protein
MHSLTSELDVGEWSASHSGRFTPREVALCTHWIGGWVGPSAGVDTVVKRKIPSPCRESKSDLPALSQVSINIEMQDVPETLQEIGIYFRFARLLTRSLFEVRKMYS